MDNSKLIQEFLEGKDPMKKIVNIECGYEDKDVSIIYRDDKDIKRIKKEPFFPFLWCKQSVARELFDGDRNKLKRKLNEYGINVKGLNIYNNDGETTERIENGYRIIFEAKFSMSYKKFLMFFSEGGKPLYSKGKNSTKNNDYLAVTPVEQFMIYSGKRLFKGYEDYDELKRFIFDIETTGLYAERDRINQIGVRTNKGMEELYSIEGNDEDLPNIEKECIIKFLKCVHDEKPDILTGHNIENFDIDFFIKRLSVLGTSMEQESLKFFRKPIYKKSKQSILKLGGEIEYYYPTVMWGHYITDSLHAVRRAQAIDSNMKKADLKYVTKYSNLDKENRVYVPGNEIYKVWSDTENKYAFNNKNGKWFKITEDILNKTYTNDNNETLNKFKVSDTSVLDEENDDVYEITTGKYIVKRYLADDLYEADKVELRYNQSNFLLGKLLPIPFNKVCTMGTAGIWKMIMLAWSYEHGLAVPSYSKSSTFTGGLSRLLSVGYVDRIVKLDYNSLYPSIILTWGISTKEDITNVMLMILEHILTEREKFKALKGKAGKEAKKKKKEIENFKGSKEELQKLNNELKAFECEESANDKKQLPFKIFGNSFFGSFGAPNIFNWGDLICAEKTTCIGRQSLRLMISWFTNRGYKPIVGDTDGFNFKMPSEDELSKRYYVGKGLNRDTVLGKEYRGVEADVAEFDDLFMRGKMGLGIDEYAQATINFSRKNYADFLENGKIKLVGNTIKSKKMPIYIEKFMNKAIKLLLYGKGQDFLNEYYDYIDKIYNLKIPLKDIASIGKIKKNIEDYIMDCNTLTSAGNKKSRQAWYELVIKNNVKVHMGDSIYYINTGKSKSHSDVKRITHYYVEKDGIKTEISKEVDKLWKDYKLKIKNKEIKEQKYVNKVEYAKTEYKNLIEEDELIFNCIMLDNNVIDSEEDIFCDEKIEYNVSKYIDQFNKRIKPLLVCFSKSIRDKIIITNPKDRLFFTKEESSLVAGEPNSDREQDTYEQLMTMEDKEIKFWIKVNEKPPFVDECGMDWDEIVNDYKKRENELIKLGVQDELNEYNKIIDELTVDEVEDFLEDGIMPSKLLKIIEEDVNSNDLISKKYKVKIGTIFDIIDKDFDKEAEIKYSMNE